MVWVAYLVGIVLVGVLVLLPAIAAVLAAGAAGALAVAVPATFILAATGGARVPDQSALVLGVVADDRLARRRQCHHQSLAAAVRGGPVPYPEPMPRRQDHRDLSSAAQEYLLALRVMAADGSKVTAAQVARHLGVTTQAASEMFRRLVADGLVAHADSRELQLSTAGRAAADTIFRRHALIEWLLTSVVGLGWAESDEEAMRLQGAISPRVEARLDEMLGHPETCPHGNPIDAAIAARRPKGIPLSEIEAGEQATVYRITEEAEEDAGLLSYLEARALRPGAHITVLARSGSLDSLTLEGPRGRATLGLHPAALVHVLRGEADPALFHTVPTAAS